MNSKMTAVLFVALVVATASAAPKPRNVYASPLATVTYTSSGGIAYPAPATFLYPVLDSSGQIIKDQDCPGCPELIERAAPAYII